MGCCGSKQDAGDAQPARVPTPPAKTSSSNPQQMRAKTPSYVLPEAQSTRAKTSSSYQRSQSKRAKMPSYVLPEAQTIKRKKVPFSMPGSFPEESETPDYFIKPEPNPPKTIRGAGPESGDWYVHGARQSRASHSFRNTEYGSWHGYGY
ncbi:hypothetical protein E6O75_ATG00355 [Venturia nashicola]|uniref:Uncharacterized protein n=1 Tax=Venturia nashicola TaxID=86259 RepID=A0A4Z1PTI5_9PEZI|nr:hypothetical protein E6O75_ATG00355 [Venturia nashicola]